MSERSAAEELCSCIDRCALTGNWRAEAEALYDGCKRVRSELKRNPGRHAVSALQDVQQLLTQARTLIVEMAPQQRAAVETLDELVHAALIRAESELGLQPSRERLAAAVAEAERLLGQTPPDATEP